MYLVVEIFQYQHLCIKKGENCTATLVELSNISTWMKSIKYMINNNNIVQRRHIFVEVYFTQDPQDSKTTCTNFSGYILGRFTIDNNYTQFFFFGPLILNFIIIVMKIISVFFLFAYSIEILQILVNLLWYFFLFIRSASTAV